MVQGAILGFGSSGRIRIRAWYCQHWKLLVLLQCVQRICTKMPSLYNRFVTCNSFFGMPTLISFKRVAVVPSIEDRSRRMGTIGLLAHVQQHTLKPRILKKLGDGR